MTDEAKKYLSDIQQAIDLIEEFMIDIENFFDYQSNSKTKSAVERQLGIIGEAANRFKKANVKFELNHLPALKSETEKLLKK